LNALKARGFNFIRLRTFVDPKAADGYDKTNGYADITHTVEFGKQIKDAAPGMLIHRCDYQRYQGDPNSVDRLDYDVRPTRRRVPQHQVLRGRIRPDAT
jgi:arabinogalactan endo-1,4-beta-galactosidase